MNKKKLPIPTKKRERELFAKITESINERGRFHKNFQRWQERQASPTPPPSEYDLIMSEYTGSQTKHGNKSLDELKKYYLSNEKDDGRFGRVRETELRYELTGYVRRVHPLGKSDIIVAGSVVESKTGCGQMVCPCYNSFEEAVKAWETYSLPFKFIGYQSKATMQRDVDDDLVRIFTIREWIDLMDMFGLRKKRYDKIKDQYGWGIQEYKPRPNFNASEFKYHWFLIMVDIVGRTLDEFKAHVATFKTYNRLIESATEE